MRALVLLAAVMAVSVSAALAQETTTTTTAPAAAPYVPEWGDVSPGNIPIYPVDAAHRQVAGEAVICCAAGDGQTVSCRVQSETPTGVGFGDGALRLGARMRLTPESAAALAQHPGTILQLKVSFITTADRRGAIQVDDTGFCAAQ